jgi:hypothetical protein
MQRAQRTFGRFLKRAPNEADVEAMLTDFTDSEQMLEKVCPIGIPITAAVCVGCTGMNWRGFRQPNNFQTTRNTQRVPHHAMHHKPVVAAARCHHELQNTD